MSEMIENTCTASLHTREALLVRWYIEAKDRMKRQGKEGRLRGGGGGGRGWMGTRSGWAPYLLVVSLPSGAYDAVGCMCSRKGGDETWSMMHTMKSEGVHCRVLITKAKVKARSRLPSFLLAIRNEKRTRGGMQDL